MVFDGECVDDPSYLHNGNQNRNYDWFGFKPDVRCDKFHEGKVECPVACNICTPETNDDDDDEEEEATEPQVDEPCVDKSDYLKDGFEGQDHACKKDGL